MRIEQEEILMSYTFSRRDFMKAAAATVLAVSAAGVLTGCGGDSEIPSATIGLGEFDVTVAADMILTGDEAVGNENAKSYLYKPNVRIKYNGSGLVGDAFVKVFHAKIDKNELELQNKPDVLVKTAGAFSKTVTPQFKASLSDYNTFKQGTPFKLYVTLQGQSAEFTLTSDGKVTVAAVDKV